MRSPITRWPCGRIHQAHECDCWRGSDEYRIAEGDGR